ncbi:MAG: glycosyltransferase family 2 protein [Thermoplasmata archaeon]
MLAAVAIALGAVAAILVLLYHGVAIWFAYRMPRLDPDPPPAPGVPPLPSVRVILAARNEADAIDRTLDSLLAQDIPLPAIVAVDGGSTDGTRERIDRRAPRIRRIDEPPLPPGWVGKSWALHVGAQGATEDWLLFLDADVGLHPAAVRTALAWAVRERADLASLATRVEMVGPWERIVLPLYIQLILTHLRAPDVNRPDSTAAMANGQFLLVRREAYAAIGGHEAIREQIVEDVALAQRARAAGMTLRVAWAPELVSTRMYRDRAEMAEGILKTVHGTSYSRIRQLGRLVGLIGLFWLPLGLLPLGVALGSPVLAALGGLLWIALFGKHAAFARAVGARARDGLAFPVAVGFYVVLLARSIARGGAGGTVRWKGRDYRLRPPGERATR